MCLSKCKEFNRRHEELECKSSRITAIPRICAFFQSRQFGDFLVLSIAAKNLRIYLFTSMLGFVLSDCAWRLVYEFVHMSTLFLYVYPCMSIYLRKLWWRIVLETYVYTKKNITSSKIRFNTWVSLATKPRNALLLSSEFKLHRHRTHGK